MLPSGAIFFILIAAVILAAGLAWAVAALYERRMLALMSGGSAPEPTATTGKPALVAPSTSWGAGVNLAANRKATTRLMLYLGGLSLLIAFTQTILNLLFIYPSRQFTLNRLLLLSAIYAWPMVLAWGLARRWSWRRILGYLGLYMLGMLVLVMFRSTAAQSLSTVSVWLFSQVAVPMTIVLLIGASGRIRAVVPYLLPPALLLAGSSVLALQFVTLSAQDPPPWVVGLLQAIGAYPTLLLIALAPWLVLAWPVFQLGKWLASAYRAKRFSDLSYLIATYWFLILFSSALPGLEEVRWLAFVEILPWLWIPVFLVVLRGPLAPPPGPPTLLVLRVFQRDAQVELLFDQVIERWRLTGNTVLIAGTDLLTRTLDPDDLFVYLNGTLAERFIASPAQVEERIAGFDWLPDPDGRYRINECYCFDSTWQTALHTLVARSDVVLMDLRGFSAENKGCRHELGVLAKASHLRRVVVLHDKETARAVAELDTNSDSDPAVAARFHWLPADRMDHKMAGRVLAALFARAT